MFGKSIRKSVKGFFVKDGYDFDRLDIDLYNFHPQLRVFIAASGVFFNNKNSLLRFVWPIVCGCLTLIASTMELIFILHGIQIKDYSFATECFCYFVILGVVPSVLVGELFNSEKLLIIVDEMNKDFLYICKLNSKYRVEFLKGQLLIWQLCFAWLFFTIVVASMYAFLTLIPLMYLSLFGVQDEFTVRPLIFPIWLPHDDPYRSPNYELFMLLQIMILFLYVQIFAVYVYVQFHVLLHNYKMLDMIMFDLEEFFDGLDESAAYLPRHDPRRVSVQRTLNARMKRVVDWHSSVFRSIFLLSSVQGPPLLYQTLFSSIAVCLIMYQIVEKLDNGIFDILFAMLGLASCMQVWIPCYLGTMLRNKAFAVGDACWSSGWHETSLGRLMRTDFTITILRAQRPLSIKYIGLPPLSLETFSAIMTSAYSYFNMLRQYD